MKKIMQLEFIEKKDLGLSAKNLTFKVLSISDSENFTFTPGQFISLFLDIHGMTIKRSYSIANLEPSNTIDIAATDVEGGLATNYLFNLKPKQIINASGPMGKLILPRDLPFTRILLIGTGTGAAPYRAMLRQISSMLKSNQIKSAHIIQGVRTKEHIIYAEDFANFASNHDNLFFYPCLSREKNLAPDSKYPNQISGYVQNSLPIIKPDAQNDIALLCGSPYMIEDNIKILHNDYGFPMTRIIREKYYTK